MVKTRSVLAVLMALFALLTLLDRFALIELLARRITIPLLAAAAEALAILAVGARARRSAHIDAPLDFLIGYPLFGAICFLVATIRISAWTMAPLVGIGAVAAALLAIRRFLERAEGRDKEAAKPPLPALGPSGAAVLALLACALVWAQAPPSTLDELADHLAIPHTWSVEGRAIDLPLVSHSYFPLAIESADVPLLALLGPMSGGIASHLLHLFAAIAATLLIVRRSKSWLATAAIVSTPALAITAGWSLVEWPLLGLFVALYVALENDDPNTATAATAAGMLVGYTFLPFGAIAWALKKRIPGWIALAGLLFFVRNLILTGNPIAPFFGVAAPHLVGYRALSVSDYLFQGKFVDEALGASLVAMPMLASGAIAFASVALLIALFFLGPSSRILAPFLVVPALSAAPALRRRLLSVLVAIAVVVQTLLIVWFAGRGGAFALLSGSTTDVEYLQNARASYVATEWLNQTLPADSRTLLIGEGETYWLNHSVRGGGNFDGPRVSRYLDLPTPEAVRQRLRNDGITHIAILSASLPTHVDEKLDERRTTLSPTAQKSLAQTLDRYAGTVTSHGPVTLFALRESPSP
jgi:hypothetical protein